MISSGCLVETRSGWCSSLSSVTSELVEGSGKADRVKMYSNHYFIESKRHEHVGVVYNCI